MCFGVDLFLWYISRGSVQEILLFPETPRQGSWEPAKPPFVLKTFVPCSNRRIENTKNSISFMIKKNLKTYSYIVLDFFISSSDKNPKKFYFTLRTLFSKMEKVVSQ